MGFPIEMYRIKKRDVQIQMPCEKCAKRGIVNKNCHKCGGKGVHKKTIPLWVVSENAETIRAIDRASDAEHEGILRYWDGPSTFFFDDARLLHFTKEDAEHECDIRNREIKDLLDIIKANTKIQDCDDREPTGFTNHADKMIYVGDEVSIYGMRCKVVKEFGAYGLEFPTDIPYATLNSMAATTALANNDPIQNIPRLFIGYGKFITFCELVWNFRCKDNQLPMIDD